MPSAYSVLGQVTPAATTGTDLYTVPALTSSVVSTITVCNRGTSAATFRIYVRVAGANSAATPDNKQYIVYDGAIAANDMLAFTLGITLATTDVISVYASTANLSFSAFGSKIT